MSQLTYEYDFSLNFAYQYSCVNYKIINRLVKKLLEIKEKLSVLFYENKSEIFNLSHTPYRVNK